MNWETSWRQMLSLPEATPQWIVAAAAVCALLALVIVPAAGLVSYIDRKLGADLQARVGPNRAGPGGLFQPVADFIKTLLKVDADDASRPTLVETAWIFFAVAALFSSLAFLPLASSTLLVDTDMSAFLPFCAAFSFSLGMAFFGLSQGSVPGFFGGLRILVQACSGGFPAVVGLLCAGLRSTGFRWSQLAAAQGFSPIHWTLFSSPFQFVAFIVFLLAGLVIFGIPPLDAGYSEADMQGGVAEGLRGRRLILFRLARFYGFFLWSVITVVVFVGAWSLPGGLSESLSAGGRFFAESAWLGLKALALMTIVIWGARVLPRIRGEQVADFSWKVLSPFALFALMGSAVWSSWGYL